MANVLVIAKSSEFENADYLDVRPLLVEAGVRDFELVELFDVARLRETIPRARFIIMVSGVLGDRDLRVALNGELSDVWHGAVTGDCSILIFSQLLLAGSGEGVPGLPDQLRIRPVARPGTEPKSQGRIAAARTSGGHQFSLLPEQVDFARLNQRALDSSLQGLYWHWWQPERDELWKTLVTDADSDDSRPLVLEHLKPGGRSRIMLSSIALDRIRDDQLLTNLIQLGLGGDYNVGLVDSKLSSLSTGMIISSFRAAGMRVFVYDAHDEIAMRHAAVAIAGGVHDAVVVTPDVPTEVMARLDPHCVELVESGRLRVLRIAHVDPAQHTAQLEVAERGSTDGFEDRLAQARWVLSRGLIGQSIFDTAKVLGAFLDLEPTIFQGQDWSALTSDLLERVRPNGSFEGPAVPTAAFVFVASVILGESRDIDLRLAVTSSTEWLVSALAGESTSNLARSAVYLVRAQQRGLAVPDALRPDALARHIVGSGSLESKVGFAERLLRPRERLNLLQVDIERDHTARATRLALELIPDVADGELAGPGGQADTLMALLAVHRMLSRSPGITDAPHQEASREIGEAITGVAASLATQTAGLGIQGSFPLMARVAIALEDYARTVSVPTQAIVGMVRSVHDSSIARQRWDDAIEFSIVARTAVQESRAQQTKLSRTITRLRFQQRYWRSLVLVLAAVSLVSAALLYFIVEPDFSRLPTAWGKLISNWGLLSGIVSVLIPLIAWAVFAGRSREKPPIDT